jgi:hypothetical protein
MNEKTLLDRIHARAQGWLTPAEAAELERALDADPALAALARDYERVHELTRADPLPPLSARTTLDDLEARVAPRRIRRSAVLVAGLLLVAALAFALGRLARPAGRTVFLAQIPLDPAEAPVVPALPASWSDFDPRGDGGVRFLRDVAEAELLARTVERPLLVYGSYPGCPMCAALDREVFADPAVVALAERTVPVRINLADLPEVEQRSLVARGYPFLEMWAADGRPTHALARRPDAASFVESMHDGLAASGAVGEQLPWEALRAAVRRLERADELQRRGSLGEAEALYSALLSEPSPATIRERASAALAHLGAEAAGVLRAARRAAESDPRAGARLLEEALTRFARTRFAADLGAVLERLRADGRFPALAEGDPSA